MAQEIGFYDGRWARQQIILLDLDQFSPQPRAEAPTTVSADSPATLTVQEFLSMYKSISVDELQAFLTDRTSPQGLADRANVDLDQLTSLMSGALQNPSASMSVACSTAWRCSRSCWASPTTPLRP